MKNKFSNYIDKLQKTITSYIEKFDGKSKFKKDNWNREKGGGGRPIRHPSTYSL